MYHSQIEAPPPISGGSLVYHSQIEGTVLGDGGSLTSCSTCTYIVYRSQAGCEILCLDNVRVVMTTLFKAGGPTQAQRV